MKSGESYFGSVMIVDDSEIDVLVNRRLMEITHFASGIIVAHDGEEALRYLRQECKTEGQVPDWIFLDMHLPVLNGPAFVEAFEGLPSFVRKKARIVVLSVMQQPGVMEKILRHPFVHGRMEKPLSQQGLLDLAAKFSPVST